MWIGPRGRFGVSIKDRSRHILLNLGLYAEGAISPSSPIVWFADVRCSPAQTLLTAIEDAFLSASLMLFNHHIVARVSSIGR